MRKIPESVRAVRFLTAKPREHIPPALRSAMVPTTLVIRDDQPGGWARPFLLRGRFPLLPVWRAAWAPDELVHKED